MPEAKRVLAISDIDQFIHEITQLRKTCKEQVRAQKNKASKLWNRKFVTLEDIHLARSEVKRLLTLFDGQEIDMEDIITMDRQLGQFERDIALWQDIHIPTDELKEMVDRRIQELVALQSDDNPPPCDVEQVYPGLLDTILAKRLKLAREWVAANLPADEAALEAMPAQACH